MEEGEGVGWRFNLASSYALLLKCVYFCETANPAALMTWQGGNIQTYMEARVDK